MDTNRRAFPSALSGGLLACLAVALLAACGRAPTPAQPAAAPPAQAAATAAPESPAAPPATPDALVTGFYSMLQSMGLRGAPTADQLARLAPLLDPALRDLLREARRVHDEARAAAPTEKPPFNDGDLFSSLFEGPSSFTVVAVDPPAQDGSRRVTVEFSYGEAPNVTRWKDSVIARPAGGGFVVGDIEFGGTWEFGNQGSLVQSLRAGIGPAAAAP